MDCCAGSKAVAMWPHVPLGLPQGLAAAERHRQLHLPHLSYSPLCQETGSARYCSHATVSQAALFQVQTLTAKHPCRVYGLLLYVQGHCMFRPTAGATQSTSLLTAC